jgi:hypothetical protein
MAAAVALVAAAGLFWVESRRGGVSAALSGVTNAIAGGPQASLDQPLEDPAAPKQIAAEDPTRRQRTHPATVNSSHGQSGEARNESPGAPAAPILSPVPFVAPVRSGVPSSGVPGAQEAAQTYVIFASEPGVNASNLIYSKADAAVTPPRQVYPALPAEPPATMRRALTVIDLVIAPDGLVERVHLRTTPRDIHEFMLLSAAKAWRFQPALLDGRPVRFRHSVALTSFQ